MMDRRYAPIRRLFGSLALAGLALVFIAASPAPFESAIRWDAKNAYRNCDGAIDGSITWPAEPKATCVAMLMCANEAALSDERRRRLIEQIRRVPNCAEP